MAHFPEHAPAKWEYTRGESDVHVRQRKAREEIKQHAESIQGNEKPGIWWEDQRYVNQVLPSQFTDPKTFDHFNYGYQVYARQPVQCPLQNLSEASDAVPPVRYNVKRVAIDHPYTNIACSMRCCTAKPVKEDIKPTLICNRIELPPLEKNNNQQINHDSIAMKSKDPGRALTSYPTNMSRNVTQSTSSVYSASVTSSEHELCIDGTNNNSNNNNSKDDDNTSHGDIHINQNENNNLAGSNSSNDKVINKKTKEINFKNNKNNNNNMKNITANITYNINDINKNNNHNNNSFINSNNNSSILLNDTNDEDLTRTYLNFIGSGTIHDSYYPCNSHCSKSSNRNQTHIGHQNTAMANVAATSRGNQNQSTFLPKGKQIVLNAYPIHEQNQVNNIDGCKGQQQPSSFICRPSNPNVEFPSDKMLQGRRTSSNIDEEDRKVVCQRIYRCSLNNTEENAYLDGVDPLVFCEIQSKQPGFKPKPGYGTYKIIGSKQYREPPQANIIDNMDLPEHLKKFRDYQRRCPDVRRGRYDKSNSLYEMLLPAGVNSTKIFADLNPFRYARNSFRDSKPPVAAEPPECFTRRFNNGYISNRPAEAF